MSHISPLNCWYQSNPQVKYLHMVVKIPYKLDQNYLNMRKITTMWIRLRVILGIISRAHIFQGGKKINRRVVENLLPGAYIDVWRPKRKRGQACLQGRLSITKDIAQRHKQFNQAAEGRTTPLRIGPLYLKVSPDPMCTPKKKRRLVKFKSCDYVKILV